MTTLTDLKSTQINCTEFVISSSKIIQDINIKLLFCTSVEFFYFKYI